MTTLTKQHLDALSDFYQLMALMLRLPNAYMIESLHSGRITQSFIEIIEDLPLSSGTKKEMGTVSNMLRNNNQATSLSALRYAYTSLFTHPDKPEIPLYESQFLFWKDNPDASFDLAPRMFVNAAAVDAERLYRKAGLSRSEMCNEPADHMSTELDFMALLYSGKSEAIKSGEGNNEQSAIDCVLNEFLHLHFQKWAIGFFEECASRSVIPLYEGLGGLGALFMREILIGQGLLKAS